MKVVNMKTAPSQWKVKTDRLKPATNTRGVKNYAEQRCTKKTRYRSAKGWRHDGTGGLAKVVGVSVRESENSDSHSQVDLQITDFGMENQTYSAKTAAERCTDRRTINGIGHRNLQHCTQSPGASRTINSLTEKSKEAGLCDLHYESARLEVLADFDWNFAIKRVALA